MNLSKYRTSVKSPKFACFERIFRLLHISVLVQGLEDQKVQENTWTHAMTHQKRPTMTNFDLEIDPLLQEEQLCFHTKTTVIEVGEIGWH